MMRAVGRRHPAVVLSLLLVLGACSTDREVKALTGKSKARTVLVPSQILGLKVAQENVSSDLKRVKRPYIDSAGLFSFREGDLLRASLQVSHFNRAANPKSARFRASIIALMGVTKPLEIKVGDLIVYSTSGNRQNIFVWFRGRTLSVLSVHQDYEFPRTLLRRVVSYGIQL